MMTAAQDLERLAKLMPAAMRRGRAAAHAAHGDQLIAQGRAIEGDLHRAMCNLLLEAEDATAADLAAWESSLFVGPASYDEPNDL